VAREEEFPLRIGSFRKTGRQDVSEGHRLGRRWEGPAAFTHHADDGCAFRNIVMQQAQERVRIRFLPKTPLNPHKHIARFEIIG
jgi:hypothetical protein